MSGALAFTACCAAAMLAAAKNTLPIKTFNLHTPK
jgi:hypothetical protein